MKKKFKDTGLGKFLGKIVPGALDVIGDTFPPVGAVLNLLDNKKLSPEQEVEKERLIQEYELEVFKINLDNTKDARAMQIAHSKSDDKFTRRFTPYLATVVVVLCFAYIFCATFITIPEANKSTADLMTGGAAIMALSTVINFFFGSSNDDKKKTK